MSIKIIVTGILGSSLIALGIPLTAYAASSVVVTPVNEQGWSSHSSIAETDPGGAVNFIDDISAPAGVGALQMTTTATASAKAQYMHPSNVRLSSVTSLSYYTKQVSASFSGADPSYQLPVFLNGTDGYTTLVYEPYQNPLQGPVVAGSWQKWDVSSGLFWSTRNVTCTGGAVTKAPGGPATYTLTQIKALCPSATVIGYGLNIGSNNLNYNVEADLLKFNDVTYNFEPTVGPPSKESQCDNNGWKNFNNPSFNTERECENYLDATAKGNLTLGNPHQKIKFNVANQSSKNSDEERNTKVNTVEYWNYDFTGGTLHYKATVICTNVNPVTREARFVFQIPAGHPGLSGMYVVAYVKDTDQKGKQDLYGHAATADLTTATTWCHTGVGFNPTMYAVTDGSTEVN